MLRITSLTAKIEITDQKEMESLISFLKDADSIPVIRSMFTGMLSLIGLSELKEEAITKITSRESLGREPFYRQILGDLFFAGNIVFALIPTRRSLVVAAIGHDKQEDALRKFCENIKEGIKERLDGRRVRGMNFDWKEVKRTSRYLIRQRRFSNKELAFEEYHEPEIDLRVSRPSYLSEDISAVKLLVNDDIRQFTLKLAQVGKMTSKDTLQLAESDFLQKLSSLDLMKEEYLLTCKQDQHTICVVPSKEHLTKKYITSLRCSACNRSLDTENLQIVYSLTERGKKLVDGSLWMSIWITELLKRAGIEEESIKWNMEASGEELDIMVEDFGMRFFFELKDREFGLGDAYPFVYRITRYGGGLGIIATMDKISTDAKKFFEETERRREYPFEIYLLEGVKNIENGITKIVEEMALLEVRRTIQYLSTSIGLDLWPIIEHWISTKIP